MWLHLSPRKRFFHLFEESKKGKEKISFGTIAEGRGILTLNKVIVSFSVNFAGRIFKLHKL